MIIELVGFNPAEEAMIKEAQESLQGAGYDVGLIKTLVRVDMPSGYRAMTLEDGAALGEAAFSSQAMLNHVLEEELLHLQQKAKGYFQEFVKGTAKALEDEIDDIRKFPLSD